MERPKVRYGPILRNRHIITLRKQIQLVRDPHHCLATHHTTDAVRENVHGCVLVHSAARVYACICVLDFATHHTTDAVREDVHGCVLVHSAARVYACVCVLDCAVRVHACMAVSVPC